MNIERVWAGLLVIELLVLPQAMAQTLQGVPEQLAGSPYTVVLDRRLVIYTLERSFWTRLKIRVNTIEAGELKKGKSLHIRLAQDGVVVTALQSKHPIAATRVTCRPGETLYLRLRSLAQIKTGVFDTTTKTGFTLEEVGESEAVADLAASERPTS